MINDSYGSAPVGELRIADDDHVLKVPFQRIGEEQRRVDDDHAVLGMCGYVAQFADLQPRVERMEDGPISGTA